MSFEPKNFINISKELQCGATEAHYRSIINRAYYGVFGYIKKRLPIYVDNRSVHREVIRLLRQSTNEKENLIASMLEKLLEDRNEADYQYNIKIKAHNCHYVIQDAEKIIDIFDKRDEEEDLE